MTSSHSVQCRCGRLRGVLKPTRPSNRCICYCRDCRTFARHLGDPDKDLDKIGGSEIIQVPPANLSFTQGQEHLACLRLTEKGMLRWYASCCRTPIGNTTTDWRMSFVGLVHSCLRGADRSLDDSFGPVTMWTHVGGALGESNLRASGELGGIAGIAWFILKARLNGRYKKTPFFHADSGLPVASPHVLSQAELEAARRDT